MILRPAAHVRPQRIESEVSDGLEELRIALDQAVVESSLPECTTTTPLLVVRARVCAMKVLETAAQRGLSRAQHQMVVRAHQSVRHACPFASFEFRRKKSQEAFAIVVIAKELAG